MWEGEVSYLAVCRGHFLYLCCSLGVKVLAVGPKRESAISRRLEYYYKYMKKTFRSMQFGYSRESGRISTSRCYVRGLSSMFFFVFLFFYCLF